MNLPITFCISTYNNLPYLKLAIQSVRDNSHFKDAPFIIHAENCTDGTDEWLEENKEKFNLQIHIDRNEVPLGIGGGMNFCADRVETKYIMFLHSDFVVVKDWDLALYELAEEMEEEDFWLSSYRVEPKQFPGQQTRPGTLVIEKEFFGDNWKNFEYDSFLNWGKQFSEMNESIIPKGEGVSGLIRKDSWDKIGGNDPLFAPASWEDMDLFLRMINEGFKFSMTTKSVVWHFGARGSHRLEENEGKSSQRQIDAEKRNRVKWLEKWGKLPKFNEYGMICGLQ